ncbi:MAG: hypothetical protein IKE92_06740 [Clostridiales bacterium]|nr:hypothetical protein [Clostridiales bacterium]
MVLDYSCTRIESKLEVQAYLQNLHYALEHGARLTFQEDRIIDQKRDIKYTNRFTIADLFPNENPSVVLKKELRKLTVSNYIGTVKDIRFKNRSEMREFGKIYDSKGDVYIKIRVELLKDFGNHTVFIMSFHYAEKPFTQDMFPYKSEVKQ